MSKKNINRAVNLLGMVIGGTLAYFRPMFFQNYLPIIGIGIGLFYFFSTNSVNKNPNVERITDYNGYLWFTFYKLIIGFLIGGTVVSTIVLSIDVLEQQRQLSNLSNLLPYI